MSNDTNVESKNVETKISKVEILPVKMSKVKILSVKMTKFEVELLNTFVLRKLKKQAAEFRSNVYYLKRKNKIQKVLIYCGIDIK